MTEEVMFRRRWGAGRRLHVWAALVTVVVGGLVCQLACGTATVAKVDRVGEPGVFAPDDTCFLTAVRGDVGIAVTSDRDVILVAEGVGILRSGDGGRTFESIDRTTRFRWPSVAVDGSQVWLSWIEKSKKSTALVAVLGQDLGLGVAVVESSRSLIDTELLSLGGGRLLLFVTEIDGPVNRNEGTYTVVCFHSLNGGLTWLPRSTVVRGELGVNLEDSRAIVLPEGQIVLAYEREAVEGGASEIQIVRSGDEGATWSLPTVLWGGTAVDREPGGFAQLGAELWFVASTDEGAPGESYPGSRIALIRSRDGGWSWSRPVLLIDEPDQLAMNPVVVDDAVLLPSIRRFKQPQERFLALYRVDPIGRWRLPCPGVG